MKRLETSLQVRFEIEDRLRSRCEESIQRLRRADFVGRPVAEIVSEALSLHRLAPPVLGAWVKDEKQTWAYGVPRYDSCLRAPLVDGDVKWFEVGGLGGQMVDCYWDAATREIVLEAKRPENAAKELDKQKAIVDRKVAAYRDEARRMEAKVAEKLTALVEKACRRAVEATEVFESIPYPLSRTALGPMGLLGSGAQSPLELATVPPRIPTGKALMESGPVDAHRLLLEEKAYFEVIDACMSMSNTIKRNPSTFRRFWSDAKAQNVQETPFRDVLLLGLNATFKGRATNETFNGIGKTDILLRVDDRDLFIAECKVWHGQKSYADAVTQLLGRYVTWDQLRVAVIMFVGNKDFTNTLKTLADATAQHAYCQGIELQLHEGQQLRWLARHPSDPGRQGLTVTSIAMHVPNVAEEGE